MFRTSAASSASPTSAAANLDDGDGGGGETAAVQVAAKEGALNDQGLMSLFRDDETNTFDVCVKQLHEVYTKYVLKSGKNPQEDQDECGWRAALQFMYTVDTVMARISTVETKEAKLREMAAIMPKLRGYIRQFGSGLTKRFRKSDITEDKALELLRLLRVQVWMRMRWWHLTKDNGWLFLEDFMFKAPIMGNTPRERMQVDITNLLSMAHSLLPWDAFKVWVREIGRAHV